MKTKNIALTLALVTLVSCSNLAFAGFSVPGVGGGAGNKQETKSEVKVDLIDWSANILCHLLEVSK